MSRLTTTLAIASCLALCALGAGSAAADGVSAPKKCDAPKVYPEEGGRFVSLHAASATSCAKAGNVAKAWAKCEAANGPAGRCVHTVMGFGCFVIARKSGGLQTENVSCSKGDDALKYVAERKL